MVRSRGRIDGCRRSDRNPCRASLIQTTIVERRELQRCDTLLMNRGDGDLRHYHTLMYFCT